MPLVCVSVCVSFGSIIQDRKKASSDEEDEDPLDAFMAGIEEQVKMENKKIPQPNVDPKKGTRGDIDDEDDEESYYR